MSTIVINIVGIQVNNATNPFTITTTIDVTNGPNAGTYVAVEQNGGLQPLMVFDMGNQFILGAAGVAFKNATNQRFPLTDGQTYQVVNQSLNQVENFGILNTLLTPNAAERLLVNNPPSTQTGATIAPNFIILEPGHSFTFTLDFSVYYPNLITVSPGLGEEAPQSPPNNGLCAQVSQPPIRPSQIPKMLNNGGRRF